MSELIKNALGGLLFLAVIFFLNSCEKVPAGYVGVKVHLLGGDKGVNTEELDTGRYFLTINEELYLFPTFTQNYVWTRASDEGSHENEAISFQTKEGLVVSADLGISYSVNPERVSDIFERYRKGIDEITSVYLRNAVRDALVSEAGSMGIESVYGAGKTELIKAVEGSVRNQVGPIGLDIERIYWIGELRLPDSVVAAIDAKISATQKAQQRRNEVVQAKAEADKAIESARGEAEAIRIKAEAESNAIRLRSQALRENPQVLQLEAIQKWNGVTPVYMGGNAPLPFLNLAK